MVHWAGSTPRGSLVTGWGLQHLQGPSAPSVVWLFQTTITLHTSMLMLVGWKELMNWVHCWHTIPHMIQMVLFPHPLRCVFCCCYACLGRTQIDNSFYSMYNRPHKYVCTWCHYKPSSSCVTTHTHLRMSSGCICGAFKQKSYHPFALSHWSWRHHTPRRGGL